MQDPQHKGSTRSHCEGATYTAHTCLTSTDFPRGESYQGSRDSTARRSLCKPLPLAASWIWSCEDQFFLGRRRPSGKLLAANAVTTHCKSLHLADTPQLRKCRKNGQNTKKKNAKLTETLLHSGAHSGSQRQRQETRRGKVSRAATVPQPANQVPAPRAPRGKKRKRTHRGGHNQTFGIAALLWRVRSHPCLRMRGMHA